MIGIQHFRYPHVIQLRGPWMIHGLGTASSSPTDLPFVVFDPEQPSRRGELTRDFQWLAGRNPNERVFLDCDGIIEAADVLLNEHPLGTVTRSWQCSAFDVTDLLESKNRLRVVFRPTIEGEGAVIGLAGPVSLRVESARARVTRAIWQCREPTRAESLLGSLTVETDGESDPLELVIAVNGRPIHSEPVDGAVGVWNWTGAMSAGEVDPWRPRGLGLPIRHQLTLEVTRERECLVHHEWSVGFHEIKWRSETGEIVVGDRSVRPTVQSLDLSSLGHPPAELAAPGQARLTILRGFLDFARYSFSDRVGELIVHDASADKSLSERLPTLRHHPSIIMPGPVEDLNRTGT